MMVMVRNRMTVDRKKDRWFGVEPSISSQIDLVLSPETLKDNQRVDQ